MYAQRHKLVWRHRKARMGYARAKKKQWSIPDKGKRGRTPVALRWSAKVKQRPSHKIEGYSTKSSLAQRRAAVNREVQERKKYGDVRYKSLGKVKEGALSTKRTLQMLKNLNPSRKADKAYNKDIKYIAKKYDV